MIWNYAPCSISTLSRRVMRINHNINNSNNNNNNNTYHIINSININSRTCLL